MEEKTGESFEEMYQIEEFQKQRMEEGNQRSKSRLMPVRGQKPSAPCQLEKILPKPCDYFWNTGDKEKTSQTSREKDPITSRDLEPAWLPGFRSQHWEQEDKCFQARILSAAEGSGPLRGNKNEQGPPLHAFSSRHGWGRNFCRMRGEPRGKLDGTEMGVSWRLMRPTSWWWLCQRHWVT